MRFEKTFFQTITVCCLLILQWMLMPAFAQKPNLRFKHTVFMRGLSNKNVKSILEDHKGFLWIATGNGLNRYDGYGYKVYKHRAKDPSSLADDDVFDVYEDSQKKIWVGTSTGVCEYESKLDRFKVHREMPRLRAKDFIEDKEETLYCIQRYDIYRYDRKTDKFEVFIRPRVGNDEIREVLIAPNGDLWLVYPNEIYTISKQTRKLSRCIRLGIGEINDALKDKDGNLLLAAQSGLYKYNFLTGKLLPYQFNSSFVNAASSVFEDSKGLIWFGTINNGLFLIPAFNKEPYHYQNIPGDHGLTV